METSKAEQKTYLQKNWHWIALSAILFVVGLLRIRLLDFPLERDEGEYAFVAQQILNGIPPFLETWNMKFPGTYYAYAIIMAIFGQTEDGIHAGLLIVNLLTTVFLFFLGRKISGNLAGVIAALFWSFTSLSPGVYGFAAHATQFVAFFAVAGLLLLYRALDENKPLFLFYSGLLLSCSTLMKQSGFFFFLLGLTWLLLVSIQIKKLNIKNILFLIGGFALPLLFVTGYFLAMGIFGSFWFWTVSYASEYGTLTDVVTGANNLWFNTIWVVEGFTAFWIFFIPSFVTLFFLKAENQAMKQTFLFCFLVAGILSIIPGLYFRPHYYVTLLPSLSLATGVLFQIIWESLPSRMSPSTKTKWFAIGTFGIIILTFAQNIPYLLTKSPEMLCRQDIYAGDIFADSKAIGNFIRTQTNEKDKILVFGSEPQILFYARRPSAVGYIYAYPMMEPQPFALQMQKEYSKKVQEVLPKFIIYITAPGSWARGPNSYSHIFDWSSGFMEKYYKQVGLAEVYYDQTIYFWGDEADGKQAAVPEAAMIMQMKY